MSFWVFPMGKHQAAYFEDIVVTVEKVNFA